MANLNIIFIPSSYLDDTLFLCARMSIEPVHLSQKYWVLLFGADYCLCAERSRARDNRDRANEQQNRDEEKERKNERERERVNHVSLNLNLNLQLFANAERKIPYFFTPFQIFKYLTIVVRSFISIRLRTSYSFLILFILIFNAFYFYHENK